MVSSRALEWLGYGDVMASYKDYLTGKIRITKQNISRAVSSMAAAANKRLKRIAQKGWTYAKADSERSESPDVIAGHKKFGAKGKSEQELNTELKRLQDFFESGMSSVTEVRTQAKEYNIRESELFDFVQMKEAKAQYEKDSAQYVEYEKTWSKKDQERFEQAAKAEQTRSDRRGKDTTFHEGWDDEEEWYRDFSEGVRFYNRLVEEKYYRPQRGESDTARDIAQVVVVEAREHNWTFDNMVERFNELMGQQNQSRNYRRRSRTSTSDFVSGPNL